MVNYWLFLSTQSTKEPLKLENRDTIKIEEATADTINVNSAIDSEVSTSRNEIVPDEKGDSVASIGSTIIDTVPSLSEVEDWYKAQKRYICSDKHTLLKITDNRNGILTVQICDYDGNAYIGFNVNAVGINQDNEAMAYPSSDYETTGGIMYYYPSDYVSIAGLGANYAGTYYPDLNYTIDSDALLIDGSLYKDGQSRQSVDGYILPDSDIKLLSEYDTDPLSMKGICYAKNEIYARYGRIFVSYELNSYFRSKPWYNGTVSPQEFSDEVFNDVERHNIDFLVGIENQNGAYQPS